MYRFVHRVSSTLAGFITRIRYISNRVFISTSSAILRRHITRGSFSRQSAGMAWKVVMDGGTGMRKAVFQEPAGAAAEVYLYGGQVTSWKNKENEELIFLSPRAIFNPPEIIRGGIQVCFPHVSGSGTLGQQHGVASNQMWQIDSNPPPPPAPTSENNGPNNIPYVDLVLKQTRSNFWIWPNNYTLRQRISVGSTGELTSNISISNFGLHPFTFTFALLNYLYVSDISSVRVHGLATVDYLDRLKNNIVKNEASIAIRLHKKTDRTYVDTPAEITLSDLDRNLRFTLKKDHNLPDVVLWTPYKEKKLARLKARLKSWFKPKTAGDNPLDEYQHMLCLGAGAVERPITLQPNEEWTACQTISPIHYFGQQGV